jgi:hypothetical protein
MEVLKAITTMGRVKSAVPTSAKAARDKLWG